MSAWSRSEVKGQSEPKLAPPTGRQQQKLLSQTNLQPVCLVTGGSDTSACAAPSCICHMNFLHTNKRSSNTTFKMVVFSIKYIPVEYLHNDDTSRLSLVRNRSYGSFLFPVCVSIETGRATTSQQCDNSSVTMETEDRQSVGTAGR